MAGVRSYTESNGPHPLSPKALTPIPLPMRGRENFQPDVTAGHLSINRPWEASFQVGGRLRSDWSALPAIRRLCSALLERHGAEDRPVREFSRFLIEVHVGRDLAPARDPGAVW